MTSHSRELFYDSSSSILVSCTSRESCSTSITEASSLVQCNTHDTQYGAAKVSMEALQAEKPGYGTCTVFGASMNLVNAMMGTGIIGLPLALHYCGFWLGLVCSVIVAFLTGTAMHLTVLSGMALHEYSLGGLCQCLLGDIGSQVVNFIVFFHTAGTAVSYYILLGDTLPALLGHYFPQVPYISDRRYAVICFGLFCSLPLSLTRSTARITKWSTLGVMLLPFMLLGIIIRVPKYAPSPLELEVAAVSPDMFKGLAIMGLAFGCSQNIFGVYLSQRDQRPSQWLHATSIAILLAYLANFVFAVMGYLCFGKNVQANVLLNFPMDDGAINLVRLALGLFMVLTIPLCIHPCREAVQKMMGLNENGRITTNKEHVLVTIGVFILILCFGATLTSLGKVFDVVGGFSTIALGFLLPGAAYIRIFLPHLIYGEATKLPLLEPSQGNGLQPTWGLMVIAFSLVCISFPIMYFAIVDAILA
ncbi:transmembrane amino acid transporter protein-domain-containing protein [Radiomyces spectabilis]|uniref:transmembrane amino acid transporter protein-domain-containing protein n=1 Tax=Radiomyces spectabilis TaxID=64574 RepID=UPI002220B07F|nr:transmembrane amino acid transporter protein-domain-containing protein [Radiomyces spectabilis]KAI8381437.1 transmembrane amino acid transporter protein-domain-containing protein [Radiomyces spectabilis]